MIATPKAVDGRKVIFGFMGVMGLFALVGLVVVIWIRSQPIVQSDQRTMARLLSNAFQKYRYDVQAWPTDAYDAAMNFQSENPTLAARVKKAELEWGLKSEMIDPSTDSPSVKITFSKPSPLELTFSLYNRERKRR